MAAQEPTERPSLRDESAGVVAEVRGALLHAAQHVCALAELFSLEAREYGRSQVRRLVLLLVGAALLGCAYLMLNLLGVLVLGRELRDYVLAASIVAGFNAVVGGVVVLVALCRKPAGMAPATCRELKDDLQCVKLYLKGKGNS